MSIRAEARGAQYPVRRRPEGSEAEGVTLSSSNCFTEGDGYPE